MLQKKLEDCDEEIKDLIFEETIETFMDIMNDPFGNYLAQKIAENCKED